MASAEPPEGRGAPGSGPGATFLLAALAAPAAGLLEWLALSVGDASLGSDERLRGLLAVLAVYVPLGGLVGLGVARWRSGGPARGPAAVLGALAAAAVLGHGFGVSLVLGALALAVAVARGAARAGRHLAPAASARTWAAGLAALLAIAGGDAARSRVPPVPPPSGVPAAGRGILLVTIDTLRADRVGAYGDADARTPHLDALARRGTLFRQAITQSGFTGPSHVSILTGTWPTTHGALRNGQRMDDGIRSLAGLRERGYATAAFPSSDIPGRLTGLSRRFETDDEPTQVRFGIPARALRALALRPLHKALGQRLAAGPYRPAPATADAAVQWLDAHAGQPFFVWVHFYDPHLPYQPPLGLVRAPHPHLLPSWYHLSVEERRALVESPEDLALMHALYDAEVTYADEGLGRVLEAAGRAAPGGRLTVAVTADHGEPMGEHGLYWVRDLYEPTVRVPLVIASERPAAVPVVDAQVRLIDVAPTLLELAGEAPLGPMDGRSLVPLLEGRSEAQERRSLSFSLPDADYGRPVAAVRTSHWKLIQHEAGWQGHDRWLPADRALFDLAADPGERDDVHASHAPLAAELAKPLLGWRGTAPAPQLSPEEEELLRGLGYVTSPAPGGAAP